jgi:hypothetical protein
MMKQAILPYHGLVEIIGLGLFEALEHAFTQWENNLFLRKNLFDIECFNEILLEIISNSPSDLSFAIFER